MNSNVIDADNQATSISDSQSLQNKYLYPEFAGFEGERFLQWVLRKILGHSLHRTWEILAIHQAPGNDCFVSVSKVAEFAGRTDRTIRLDMKKLTERGLLSIRSERKLLPQADGSMRMRPVIVKDFSGLYALAHEYVAWTASESYVPPERELADLIRSDEALMRKLMHFDNYRRILTNQLPGPKPKPREDTLWFSRNGAKDAEDAKALTDQKEYLQENLQKDLQIISLKRIDTSDQRDRLDRDSFSSKVPQKRRASGYKKDDLNTDTELSPSISEETKTTTSCTAEETRVKTNEAAEEPKATTAEETRARLIERARGAQGHPGAQSRPGAPVRNEMVAAFVREVSPALRDRSLRSSLTYAQRCVEGTGLSQKEILACLVKAYLVAQETKRVRAQHRHPDGDNKMPIFCKMLDDFIKRSVSGTYYFDDEHLAADIASDDRLVLFVAEYGLEQMLLGEDCHRFEEPIPFTEVPAGEPEVEARDVDGEPQQPEQSEQACDQTVPPGGAARIVEVEDPAYGWSTYETAEWMGRRLRESLGEASYNFACLPTQHGRYVVILYERGKDIEGGWLFGTTDEVRECL